MTEDVGRVCTCTPYDERADPYVMPMLEYDPACAVHSHHVYDPRQNMWVISQAPHTMIIVEGGIEVCSNCRNIHGEYVAWDQTWHALHKDKARQVQHCWYQPNPNSEELVTFCGDPDAKPLGLHTREEAKAVPVCRDCHPRAMSNARKEEWDKLTSDSGVNIFKAGWAAADEQGQVGSRVKLALQHIREILGR